MNISLTSTTDRPTDRPTTHTPTSTTHIHPSRSLRTMSGVHLPSLAAKQYKMATLQSRRAESDARAAAASRLHVLQSHASAARLAARLAALRDAARSAAQHAAAAQAASKEEASSSTWRGYAEWAAEVRPWHEHADEGLGRERSVGTTVIEMQGHTSIGIYSRSRGCRAHEPLKEYCSNTTVLKFCSQRLS